MRGGPSHAEYCDLFDRKLILRVKHWKSLAVVAAVVASSIAQASAASDDAVARSTVPASSPVHTIGACTIRIGSLFGGHFKIPYPVAAPAHGRYYFPGPTKDEFQVVDGFGVDCLNASLSESDSVQTLLDIKRDDGRWLHKDRDDNWIPFSDDQHASVIELHGPGWSGLGLLIDDTTGDEEHRARRLSFCIAHLNHALCGDTPVALLSRPSSNELPKVKSILGTIEFVDEESLPASCPRGVNGAGGVLREVPDRQRGRFDCEKQ